MMIDYVSESSCKSFVVALIAIHVAYVYFNNISLIDILMYIHACQHSLCMGIKASFKGAGVLAFLANSCPPKFQVKVEIKFYDTPTTIITPFK